MPKINLLPKSVAELIAAGEVVERPSSVIKELVENSIDAGSSIITVEIQHGGITYIRVTDNGCGISHTDVPTAFLRHATSKIKVETDLESIATLGFRGEALAAVSSVARVEMLTRTA
ncbi:MAG: DNA mismatch repair endonuclease MutL, partial [Acutalibacteraceae bacterium]